MPTKVIIDKTAGVTDKLTDFDSKDVIILLGTLGIKYLKVVHDGSRLTYSFREREVTEKLEALTSSEPILIDYQVYLTVLAAFTRTLIIAKSQ